MTETTETTETNARGGSATGPLSRSFGVWGNDALF